VGNNKELESVVNVMVKEE